MCVWWTVWQSTAKTSWIHKQWGGKTINKHGYFERDFLIHWVAVCQLMLKGTPSGCLDGQLSGIVDVLMAQHKVVLQLLEYFGWRYISYPTSSNKHTCTADLSPCLLPPSRWPRPTHTSCSFTTFRPSNPILPTPSPSLFHFHYNPPAGTWTCCPAWTGVTAH